MVKITKINIPGKNMYLLLTFFRLCVVIQKIGFGRFSPIVGNVPRNPA